MKKYYLFEFKPHKYLQRLAIQFGKGIIETQYWKTELEIENEHSEENFLAAAIATIEMGLDSNLTYDILKFDSKESRDCYIRCQDNFVELKVNDNENLCS